MAARGPDRRSPLKAGFYSIILRLPLSLFKAINTDRAMNGQYVAGRLSRERPRLLDRCAAAGIKVRAWSNSCGIPCEQKIN
jgi:hypothetical protein